MVVKKGGTYEMLLQFKISWSKSNSSIKYIPLFGVIDQIKGVEKQPAMDNFPAMRVALESGMIDGYVSERPEAISASSANENFAMVEFTDGFDTS